MSRNPMKEVGNFWIMLSQIYHYSYILPNQRQPDADGRQDRARYVSRFHHPEAESSGSFIGDRDGGRTEARRRDGKPAFAGLAGAAYHRKGSTFPGGMLRIGVGSCILQVGVANCLNGSSAYGHA